MRHSRIPLQRLPYTTILAATCGDAMAMADVLKHYGRYINKLATRVLYD